MNIRIKSKCTFMYTCMHEEIKSRVDAYIVKRAFGKVKAPLTARRIPIRLDRDFLNVLFGVWFCTRVKHGLTESRDCLLYTSRCV